MMISTTSRGSLVAGDGHAGDVSEEVPPEHSLRSKARIRYQIRMKSNSNAIKAIVKPRNEKNGTWLPDKEDVGVFLGRIVFVA